MRATMFSALMFVSALLPTYAQEAAAPLSQVSLHASNPCHDLLVCMQSILANVEDFDLRPSFEAMQKMKSFPRADREQSLRAKAGGQVSPANHQLWREELAQGHLPEAINALRNTILLSSAPAALYLQLGALLLQNADPQAAEQAFAQGIKFAPYNSALWEAWAQANLAQGKQEAAARAIVVAYEWAAQKSSNKARYAGLANKLANKNQDFSRAYAQALEIINQRNLLLIEKWSAVSRQSPGIVREQGHKQGFLQRPELRCAPPEYPLEAARNGDQGEVRLDVMLDIDGTVLASAIDKSSGFTELDNAARLSLSACYGVDIRISGALKEPLRAKVTYNWKLEN